MFTFYLVVTCLATAANGFAATLDFLRSPKVLTAMARLGVPKPWLPILGILKAAGALGLLVGFRVPAIGIAASVGLVLFFIAAIIAHLRARDYAISQAVVFLLLAVFALALRLCVSRPPNQALQPTAQTVSFCLCSFVTSVPKRAATFALLDHG